MSVGGATRRWGGIYDLAEMLEGMPERALAQRLRETDLADLAVLLTDVSTTDAAIAEFAVSKFALVRQGRANGIERIERHLHELGATYDDVVPQLFPAAPTYKEALAIVWPRIKSLVP